MVTEQDYIQLTERHAKAMQALAVLQAEEKNKAKRLKEVKDTLTAAGIDPERPEEEKARLEKEAAEALQQAREKLDAFEKQLAAPVEPEPDVEKAEAPVPEEPRRDLPISDDDIDI